MIRVKFLNRLRYTIPQFWPLISDTFFILFIPGPTESYECFLTGSSSSSRGPVGFLELKIGHLS